MIVPANQVALAQKVVKEGGGQYYISAQVRDYLYADEVAHTDDLSVYLRLRYKKNVNDASAKLNGETPKVKISDEGYTTISGIFNLDGDEAYICTDLYLYSKTQFSSQYILVDDAKFIPLKVALEVEPANIVEIKTEVLSRSVVRNYPDYVGQDWKTALGLPTSVEVLMDNGNTASVDVTWSYAGLDFTKYGKYTLIGTLDDSAFPNPKGITVQQNIYVGKAKNLIPNPSFENNLENWSIRGSDPKPSRVKTPLKEGAYAAYTGKFTSNSTQVALAYTYKVEEAIGTAIAEFGAGQYYFGAWAQSAANSVPSGMEIQTRFLYKTMDENGNLSDKYTTIRSQNVPLSNKAYSHMGAMLNAPANIAWGQLAVYALAQNEGELGDAIYLDKVELVPLNVVLEQYEGQMVQVETIIPDRQIIQNYPDYIGAGYTNADLMLPSTVEVSTTAGQTVKVGVRWDTSKLDLTKTGIYTVYGALEDMKLPNPDGLTVKQNIRVVSKKNLLNNPSFEDDADGWDNSGHVSLELGTTSPVKDGGLSMKIKVGRLDDWSHNYLQAFYNSGQPAMGQKITRTGAGRYLFSGWAQGTASTNDLEFHLRLYYRCLSTGDKAISSSSPNVKLSTTKFTQMSNIVELPDDIYLAHLDLYFVGTPQQMRLSELYLDDFELIPLNVEIADVNDIIDCEDTADIYVHEGSTIEGLNLPKELWVIIKNGQKFDLGVTWDTATFDPNKIGVQTITGSFKLGSKYKNTKQFVPTVKVVVREKGTALRETIYFSTSGNDANDGLSPDKPKQNIKLMPTYLSQATMSS